MFFTYNVNKFIYVLKYIKKSGFKLSKQLTFNFNLN